MAGSTREWDDVKKQWKPQDGMTLRDWFAGQALAGMGCQWEKIEEYLMDSTADRVREFMAWAAYRQADKMIAAREEKE
jgi:hypothetical protein